MNVKLTIRKGLKVRGGQTGKGWGQDLKGCKLRGKGGYTKGVGTMFNRAKIKMKNRFLIG